VPQGKPGPSFVRVNKPDLENLGREVGGGARRKGGKAAERFLSSLGMTG